VERAALSFATPLLTSEMSSATMEKFIAYPILGIAMILLQVKNPTELNKKICYKRYYKNAWWPFLTLVVLSSVHVV